MVELFKCVKSSVDYKNAIKFAVPEARVKLENFKVDLYDMVYKYAISNMENAKYAVAIDLFKRFNGYKDSLELLEKYEKGICKVDVYSVNLFM